MWFFACTISKLPWKTSFFPNPWPSEKNSILCILSPAVDYVSDKLDRGIRKYNCRVFKKLVNIIFLYYRN